MCIKQGVPTTELCSVGKIQVWAEENSSVDGMSGIDERWNVNRATGVCQVKNIHELTGMPHILK